MAIHEQQFEQQSGRGGNVAEKVRESARNISQQAASCTRQGYQGLREQISGRPTSAVMLSFAVGFGLGLMLGYSLSEQPRRRWTDRHTAERFGRQTLDWMAGMLPESISKRIHG